MAVRTTRLWGPTAVSTSDVTLYTVPNDRTAIVRSVWWTVPGGAARNLQMKINGNAFSYQTIGPSAESFLDRWWVLNENDVLVAVASGSGVAITGFGVLLPGPSA